MYLQCPGCLVVCPIILSWIRIIQGDACICPISFLPPVIRRDNNVRMDALEAAGIHPDKRWPVESYRQPACAKSLVQRPAWTDNFGNRLFFSTDMYSVQIAAITSQNSQVSYAIMQEPHPIRYDFYVTARNIIFRSSRFLPSLLLITALAGFLGLLLPGLFIDIYL